MLARRREVSSQACRSLQGRIQEYAGKARVFSPQIVALYLPLEGKAEVDISHLSKSILTAGGVVALPAVLGPREMAFRQWDTRKTAPDFLGLFTGGGAFVVPDVIFVPLLAFERTGHRIGYGGGFYDKALALLASVRTIGIGFSWQEVASIGAEPHDQPLDEIWTESERILCKENQPNQHP